MRQTRAALIGCLGLVFCALGVVHGAVAQQTASDGVLVVNQNRISTESLAAQSIKKAERELRDALRRAIDLARGPLVAEEQELVRLRETLPKEEFEERVQVFERNILLVRRRSEEMRSEIDKAVAEAKDRLSGAIQASIVEIMKERGAGIVLDEGSVVVHARIFDVTGEVLERLNAAAPEVPMRRPDIAAPTLE